MVCGGRGGERAGVRGDEPGKMGRVVQVEGGGGSKEAGERGELPASQPERKQLPVVCVYVIDSIIVTC